MSLDLLIVGAGPAGMAAAIGARRFGLEVMVIDHGPGIPEEMLPKVLLPYFRVEKSRNRNTGGVGLGLTVAQASVHAHGGTIALANRPAGGLEVLVTLPLAREG